MRTLPLVLLVLVTLLAGAAAQATLQSQPAQPSLGRYLRLADAEILNYRYPYVVTLDGFAGTGILHENKVCETEEGACEVTAHSPHCNWKRGPWATPSAHGDFDHGRCVSIRTAGDGHDAVIEGRAAVRMAARSVSPGDITQIQGNWSWRFKLAWISEGVDIETNATDPTGRIINPTYIHMTHTGCNVDVSAQDPSLGGAHYFADCVWDRSGEKDPRQYIPPGLRICPSPTTCRDASITGFHFTGEVLLDGHWKGQGRITCAACFDPVTRPYVTS